MGQWYEGRGKALLAVVAAALSLLSLTVSMVSCHNSSKALSLSDEHVAISVNRIYGTEHIDTGRGVPMIMARWAIDINNLSSNPVSVLPPDAVGITGEDSAMITPPILRVQAPDKPTFIAARSSARVEVEVPIQIDRTSRSIAASGNWPNFEAWRTYTKEHGLNDIGAPVDDRRNATVQVIVHSLEGRAYYGVGLWYPGFAPPN
jgi:hypothetical protein